MTDAECSYEPCGKSVHCKSLCQGHYRLALAGEPLRPLRARRTELPRSTDLWERIEDQLVREGECLIWTGNVNNWGYGTMTYEGRPVNVRHFAYEREYGPVPEGRELRRTCEAHLCITPGHLKAVVLRNRFAAQSV